MKEKRRIAALFDLDGVVLDTENQYSIYWGKVGKMYHPEIEHFEKIIKGQTLAQIYERFFQDKLVLQKKITAELNIFEENMTFPYIAGVKDFILSLRDEGISTAVVTSSNEKKMNNVYRSKPEFKSLFDRILTADMFKASKPAPDCFLLGAEVFMTEPRNCVVFEDSFHGLEAGKRAKMKVVGLSTTNSEEAIKDLADMVIPDFKNYTTKDMMDLLNR